MGSTGAEDLELQPAGVAFGAAQRAFPGETVVGDAWYADWRGPVCRLSVIDGLGHGPLAATAAHAAVGAIERLDTVNPLELLTACHRALVSTRGAAIWVGCLDAHTGRLQYAGAGNVEGRLWQLGREQRLIGQRGIVGGILPRLRAYEVLLLGGCVLVVYSDGVQQRFQLDDLIVDRAAEPGHIAQDILAGWARSTDDATVLAAVWDGDAAA